MATIKDVQKFSKRLNVLYVEDNEKVARETASMFELLFARVGMAYNGEEGLERYNEERYDIVITDINMPRMNGIEMITRMREINPEQKIVAISAHDEADILLDMVRKGVSSFILKPINLDEMLNVLYPVCRDADAQNVNAELFEALQEERKKLKRMVSLFTSHLRTVEVKNDQIGELCSQSEPNIRSELLEEYFEKDDDQGEEKVVFLWDDCEEMTDLLSEVPDELALYVSDHDLKCIQKTGENVAKISNILYRYTPFLDPLAKNLEELSRVIVEQNDFLEMIDTKPEQLLSLFDAVCVDLSLYVKRFSNESMAMKNIHHIHQPTSLSIQQIISLIRREDADEGGDIEFF